MDTTKRYQVYLNPRSVSILDEAGDALKLARSRFIREAAEAAADRLGNMLAMIRPVRNTDYQWLDSLVGGLSSKSKKLVNYSEKIDDIYYDK